MTNNKITFVFFNHPNKVTRNKISLRRTRRLPHDSSSFSDTLVVAPTRRIIWTDEIQRRFLIALDKLGSNGVPSLILREMNVEGITREQVSSHLQKHRQKEQQPNSVLSTSCGADLAPQQPTVNKFALEYLIN